jgi:hypothetical protein
VLLLGASAIHKQGNLQVFKNCSVDLMAGDAACVIPQDGEQGDSSAHPTNKNEDFWFEKSKDSGYLSPLHNAMLAKGGLKEAGYEGCIDANYSKNRLRIDNLPVGTHICVRTGKLHYAELRLSGFESEGERALFTFVTWEDRQ